MEGHSTLQDSSITIKWREVRITKINTRVVETNILEGHIRIKEYARNAQTTGSGHEGKVYLNLVYGKKKSET